MAKTGITANNDDSVDRIKDAPMPLVETALFEAHRRACEQSLLSDEQFTSMPDWQKVATKVGMYRTLVTTYESFLKALANPDLEIVTVTVNDKKFSILPTDVLDKILSK